MRLVNDKPNGKAVEQPMLAPFLFYSLAFALMVAMPVLSPLPVLRASGRIGDTWTKLISICGAILSLLVFGAPVVAVLVSMTFAMVLEDHLRQRRPVMIIVVSAAVAAVAGGAVGLILTAVQMGISPFDIWAEYSGALAREVFSSPAITKIMMPGDGWSEATYREFLFSEGPLMFLGLFMFFAWGCVGLSAFLGWTSPESEFSATRIRRLVLPNWLGIAFIISLVLASNIRTLPFVLGIFLVIQGSALLSRILNQAKVSKFWRGLFYLFFMSFGLGALTCIGLIFPFVSKRLKQEV